MYSSSPALLFDLAVPPPCARPAQYLQIESSLYLSAAPHLLKGAF